MTRALTAAVAAAGLVPAAAHHSNVIFDLGTVITVRGAVTRYDWHNPHVYLYIASAGDSGTEWLVEADPTPIMARSGWGPDTLAVGDPVTVRAHPDATGRPAHALLISMAKADGVLLTMRSGGAGHRRSLGRSAWRKLANLRLRQIDREGAAREAELPGVDESRH
jgi:hypothetical protein